MKESFKCPRCFSEHKIGRLFDTRLFKCPRCLYIGRGFHSDRQLDAELAAFVDEVQGVRARLGWPAIAESECLPVVELKGRVTRERVAQILAERREALEAMRSQFDVVLIEPSGETWASFDAMAAELERGMNESIRKLILGPEYTGPKIPITTAATFAAREDETDAEFRDRVSERLKEITKG